MQWYTTIIPSGQETKAGIIKVQGQDGQFSESLSQKQNEKALWCSSVVLGSIPSTIHTQKIESVIPLSRGIHFGMFINAYKS